MNKRVGIWIRVSTEDQKRGDSPEHHLEKAKMYADLKEWDIVEEYHLEEYVKPWTFANSCSGHHFKTIIDTSFDTSKDKTLKGFELKYFNQIENKPENNYFIHLWNEHWRRNDIDKETQYPENCLYEQLKKLYSPE